MGKWNITYYKRKTNAKVPLSKILNSQMLLWRAAYSLWHLSLSDCMCTCSLCVCSCMTDVHVSKQRVKKQAFLYFCIDFESCFILPPWENFSVPATAYVAEERNEWYKRLEKIKMENMANPICINKYHTVHKLHIYAGGLSLVLK